MKWHLCILLLMGLVQTGLSQPCKYAPADCPVNGVDQYGTSDDSVARMENPVLPLEITMENRLRARATDIISHIAAKEGWEYAELSEDCGSGARDANGAVLAYALRSPHWMQFHFQVIVNEDSLQAWKSWLMEFARRRLDNARAGKSDAGFEAERKRQRVHFRDASVLTVEIGFNMDFAKTPDEVAVPAVTSAPIWMSNPAPDPIAIDWINRSRNCVLLLHGNWKKSPLGGGYKATGKKIKCDQIETITVHLSGNAAAIRRCLGDWPVAELDGMIVR